MGRGRNSRLAEPRLLWLGIIWIFGAAYKRNRSARARVRSATANLIFPAADRPAADHEGGHAEEIAAMDSEDGTDAGGAVRDRARQPVRIAWLQAGLGTGGETRRAGDRTRRHQSARDAEIR